MSFTLPTRKPGANMPFRATLERARQQPGAPRDDAYAAILRNRADRIAREMAYASDEKPAPKETT